MRKRKNENQTTESMETESAQTIPETQSTDQSTDSGNVIDDGSTDSTFAETQEQKIDTTALDVDVDAILEQYGTKKKRGRKAKTETVAPVETPVIIPGELLIHVSDNICVGTIGFVDTLVSKKPIDPQLLALRDEQKTQLVPAANEVSKELSKYINANPILAFGAMLGSMYLSNYLMIRAFMIQADRNKDK